MYHRPDISSMRALKRDDHSHPNRKFSRPVLENFNLDSKLAMEATVLGNDATLYKIGLEV
jgi:hypothetical protein